VFGQGPCRLLRCVEKTNSLHQAAHEMGMSYNKAWRLVRLMEERLGFRSSKSRLVDNPEEDPGLHPKRKISSNVMSDLSRRRKDHRKDLSEAFWQSIEKVKRR